MARERLIAALEYNAQVIAHFREPLSRRGVTMNGWAAVMRRVMDAASGLRYQAAQRNILYYIILYKFTYDLPVKRVWHHIILWNKRFDGLLYVVVLWPFDLRIMYKICRSNGSDATLECEKIRFIRIRSGITCSKPTSNPLLCNPVLRRRIITVFLREALPQYVLFRWPFDWRNAGRCKKAAAVMTLQC